jgi:O-antigen/teichoic acid export membrane protein
MNLADKTIINIIAKSGEAVLLLISSVVMVRFLNKEEYGTFLQIMLIMNTAIMFTGLGIPQSIYYYLHKTEKKAAFIFRNLILAIILGVIAAPVFYLLSDNISRWINNPLLSNYGYIIVLLIFLRTPLAIREPLLISRGNLIINSVTLIISNLLFYIPIIIAAFFSVGLKTIMNVLLVFTVVDYIFFLTLMVWLIRRVQREETTFSDDGTTVSLLEQLRYALPIGISSYVGVIGRQIDQYIVSVFFNPRSYAVYSRGAIRIPVLSSIQFTLNDIMMPYYVKDYHAGNISGFLDRYHGCIKNVAKINFPVFVFLFMVAPSLISFFYTVEYISAAPVFRAYLFLLLINITTYGIVARVSGKTRSIFYATVINVMTNIVLSCLLVPYLGAIGAAITTVFCVLIGSSYHIFMSCKLLNVSWTQIFPWGFLVRLLTISLIAGFPVYVINLYLVKIDFNLFVSLSLDGLIYLMSIIILFMRSNVFSEDDFKTLSRWLRFDTKKIFSRIAMTGTCL